MSQMHPLLFIVTVQIVGVGSLALAARSWIGRQKDALWARAQVLRILFWLAVAVATIATGGQVFLYATGRSPDWLPHPSTFVFLPLAGIFYERALRAARNRKIGLRTTDL